jgi:hypothetical protein
MTTEQFKVAKSRDPSRAWLLLLVLPVLGFAGCVAVFAPMAIELANVEKSPGYALAVQAVSSHAGVEGLLGAPVRVTGTKAKHLTKRPSGTTLELTLELTGSAGQGIAEVTATEKVGRWVVQRATIANARGEFGLLADGSLQPLYDPSALAAGL